MSKTRTHTALLHIREPEPFSGELSDLALAASREIERSILQGRPVAVPAEDGERPGAIASPALRLLARAAKRDLQRIAEVERLRQCRLTD